MLIDLQNLVNDVGSQLVIDCDIEAFTIQDALIDNIHVGGVVENFSGRLEIKLRYTADCHVNCSRCAEPVTLPLEVVIQDRLVQEDPDGEYILIENDKLDLTAVSQEIISLNLPIRILCGDSCKGLCPICGRNLNDNQCSCEADNIDPRLEGLRNLLNNSE